MMCWKAIKLSICIRFSIDIQTLYQATIFLIQKPTSPGPIRNAFGYNNQLMDLDQQQQKGLFTFYREQAVLEQELKQKKLARKSHQIEKTVENEKRQIGVRHSCKLNQKRDEGEQLNSCERSKIIQKTASDSTMNSQEPKDKLISILRKYHTKEIKRKDHLKIIMQNQDQVMLDKTQQLKSRLERLLKDEEDQNFNLISSQRKVNKQSQKQTFIKKRQAVKKLNPFQKLAIIPTNYLAEISQQRNFQAPFKKGPSPLKSVSYGLQVRKNDKIELSMDLKGRQNHQSKQTPSIQSLKFSLPKIDLRSNSQMLNKYKLRPSKSGEKSQNEPIQSGRYQNSLKSSLYLGSIKLSNESSSSKFGQNKIYSLFIQNKQSKCQQDPYLIDKEIRLVDVVRKMKFS